MSCTDFRPLFHPRGIAVIGASIEPRRPGSQTVRALAGQGYKGGIYPVNPKYEELQGYRCYAAVTDIQAPCDAAVVALPAAQVAEAIAQCGRKGIGFAVIVGGGFREVGPEGAASEQRMLAAARAAGVRLIGPNCLGAINVHDRVFASFGSISRPPYQKPGPVSAVMQSGGFGNSVLMQAGIGGVGFRYIVASGQESDVGTAELIRAFADDEKTRVIFAYLEGLADGRAFMEAARHALSAGKPVVVLKAGNTTEGLKAAASHSASMTSSYDVYRAAFRQCGVIEARDLQEVVDYLLCLSAGRLPRGRNVSGMGGSGGAIVNFSDAVDEFDLKLAPFSEPTMAALDKLLPPIAARQNPVDHTVGFASEKNLKPYEDLVSLLVNDPQVHQLAVFQMSHVGAALATRVRSIVKSVAGSDKPVMVLSCAPPEMTVEARAELAAAGIPLLGSPRRIAAGMAMLAGYTEAIGKRERLISEQRIADRETPALPAGKGMLDEHESKQWLSAFGIPVSRDALLPVDAQAALPAGLRFPVAVKIASPDIGHKSDIGAVRLGVADEGQLAAAAGEVVANARKAQPSARLSGVLISEMVEGGMETIIGVVNDALFGPVVSFGLGGVLAETLRDTTYRIAPFGEETAREMIFELRAAAVFKGVRGQPPRDVDALVKALVCVSECAWLLRARLAEMDINPVLVLAQGQGIVAADALMVLRE